MLCALGAPITRIETSALVALGVAPMSYQALLGRNAQPTTTRCLLRPFLGTLTPT